MLQFRQGAPHRLGLLQPREVKPRLVAIDIAAVEIANRDQARRVVEEGFEPRLKPFPFQLRLTQFGNVDQDSARAGDFPVLIVDRKAADLKFRRTPVREQDRHFVEGRLAGEDDLGELLGVVARARDLERAVLEFEQAFPGNLVGGQAGPFLPGLVAVEIASFAVADGDVPG